MIDRERIDALKADLALLERMPVPVTPARPDPAPGTGPESRRLARQRALQPILDARKKAKKEHK
jgi:hypothetical protein